MHPFTISKAVQDRVMERRGRAHVHEDFDPRKTALVVVDMQNAFMPGPHAHSPSVLAQKIIPTVNRLAQGMRAHGGTVVWIQTACTEDDKVNWSNAHSILTRERAESRYRALARGSEGYKLAADMDAKPDDVYVEKNRFSAFIQGSSNLDEVLKARGVDTIIIAGTVTNVCCESTARDAMMLNYKVIMASDANAAATDEEHEASLLTIYRTFGDVLDVDTLIACMARNSAPAQAAE
jgi:ureidoacrylate peracid hydrolase